MYSLMQSDGNSLGGDVVLDSFNPITGDDWRCLKWAGEIQFDHPPLVSRMFFEKEG